MKNVKFIIGGLVAVLVVVWVFNSMGTDAPFVEEDNRPSIVSDDGKAILRIAESALPDGVSMEDIKVTGEMVEGFYGPESDPVYVYSLEPDGLELLEPAQITLSQAWQAPQVWDEVAVPMLVHKSGDEFEIVNDVVVNYSVETSAVAVSGDITHFSYVAFTGEPSVFSMFLSVPFGLELDESGPVEFKTHHSKIPQEERLQLRKKPIYTVVSDTWKVESDAVLSISGKSYSPTEINIPAKTMNKDEEYVASEIVTCVKKGIGDFVQKTGKITFVADLKMFVPYFWGSNHDDNPDWHSDGSVHSDDEFHLTRVHGDQRMTVMYPFSVRNIDCGQEQMVQLEPYTIICLDGTSRSGAYVIDPETGERAVDKNGYNIESSTMTPVTEFDMCPGWKKPVR